MQETVLAGDVRVLNMAGDVRDMTAQKGRYVLSYGAGVNTTALMILLVKRRMPLDEAVFADTGAELEETYENVRLARTYLEKHGVPLTTVRSKTGTLFDTCVRRKVIPSQIWRWSTRDYKVTPIHAHYRSLKTHVYEYLGIAYDEIERMKANRKPYITSLFPLIDMKLRREDCLRIIEDEGFPVPIKSGCYFCPFNSESRWEYIWRHHPRKYAKAMWLEETSKHFPDQKLSRPTLRVLMETHFETQLPVQVHEEPCGAYCMA